MASIILGAIITVCPSSLCISQANSTITSQLVRTRSTSQTLETTSMAKTTHCFRGIQSFSMSSHIVSWIRLLITIYLLQREHHITCISKNATHRNIRFICTSKKITGYIFQTNCNAYFSAYGSHRRASHKRHRQTYSTMGVVRYCRTSCWLTTWTEAAGTQASAIEGSTGPWDPASTAASGITDDEDVDDVELFIVFASCWSPVTGRGPGATVLFSDVVPSIEAVAFGGRGLFRRGGFPVSDMPCTYLASKAAVRGTNVQNHADRIQTE